jgi:RNase P/RNase MRP subunit POP5
LYACNSQLQGAAFFSDSRRIFGGMERIFTDYRAAKLNHRLGYSWFEKSTSIIRIERLNWCGSSTTIAH